MDGGQQIKEIGTVKKKIYNLMLKYWTLMESVECNFIKIDASNATLLIVGGFTNLVACGGVPHVDIKRAIFRFCQARHPL